MKKTSIVFIGSSEFAVPALEKLTENDDFEVKLVVTQPDKINARGNRIKFLPVKQKALDLGLKVYQPENISSEESEEILRALSPDLFVVASYGQILKSNILSVPKYGSLNIHASILPKYRGASPIHQAVINGDTESGVTIMLLDEGMDTGDILSVETVPVDDTTTVGRLHDTLAEIGGRLLIKTIPGFLNGEIKPQKQDESKAGTAEKITKEERHINWNTKAESLLRLINGMDPFPSAYTLYQNKEIKLFKPKIIMETAEEAPGTILRADQNEGIVVACNNGALSFDEIQFPGKRRLNTKDFLRGNKIKAGTILT